jgi:hypothetical protein
MLSQAVEEENWWLTWCLTQCVLIVIILRDGFGGVMTGQLNDTIEVCYNASIQLFAAAPPELTTKQYEHWELRIRLNMMDWKAFYELMPFLKPAKVCQLLADTYDVDESLFDAKRVAEFAGHAASSPKRAKMHDHSADDRTRRGAADA